jgi:dipeptidyl aminopeptidase/acylaminoacyl peptidase
MFRAPYTPADWRPINYASERAPPTLLLHGTSDTMVHVRETRDLEKRLREAGVSVESHLYEGSSHWDTVAALSVPLRLEAATLADISHFVDQYSAGR